MRFGLLGVLIQIEPGHEGYALWRAGLLDVRQHAEESSVGPLYHPEDRRLLLKQRPPDLVPDRPLGPTSTRSGETSPGMRQAEPRSQQQIQPELYEKIGRLNVKIEWPEKRVARSV